MPELPEVETIKNDLAARLAGRRVVAIEVSDPKLIREPSLAQFQRRLPGQTIGGIRRRGKYLIFDLSSGERLIAHLKMSGALLHRSPGSASDAYTRAALILDDGSQLRFTDPRRFGALWLVPNEALVVGGLGPEAMGEGFTATLLAQRLEGRRAPIKPLLCDQGFLAGLGNLYSDEALFEAGIHPLRQGGSLASDEVARLHKAIGVVLRRALSNRGTSFSDYRDPDGRPGGNQGALRVYRRRGEPCPLCGTPIERLKLRGRGAYFCPRCQAPGITKEEGPPHLAPA